jgi:hypothetical protein
MTAFDPKRSFVQVCLMSALRQKQTFDPASVSARKGVADTFRNQAQQFPRIFIGENV